MQMVEMSSGLARKTDLPVQLVIFKGDRPQLDKTARHTGHSSHQLCRTCTICSTEVHSIGHKFDVLTNRRRSTLHDSIATRISSASTLAEVKSIKSQTGCTGGKVILCLIVLTSAVHRA
jgi:hypothetical protein